MIGKRILSLSITGILAFVAGAGIQVFGQSVTRELIVTRDAKVGDQVISKGKYSIAYDDKKDGELSLMKGGKELVKVSYKLIDLEKDAANSVVVFAASDDGSLRVRRIEMKGSKTALQFD